MGVQNKIEGRQNNCLIHMSHYCFPCRFALPAESAYLGTHIHCESYNFLLIAEVAWGCIRRTIYPIESTARARGL